MLVKQKVCMWNGTRANDPMAWWWPLHCYCVWWVSLQEMEYVQKHRVMMAINLNSEITSKVTLKAVIDLNRLQAEPLGSIPGIMWSTKHCAWNSSPITTKQPTTQEWREYSVYTRNDSSSCAHESGKWTLFCISVGRKGMTDVYNKLGL